MSSQEPLDDKVEAEPSVRVARWAGKIVGFCAMYAALIAGAALAFIPLMAWRAYAAVTLWGWFIVPRWPDLTTPSIYLAGGVMLVINSMFPHAPSPKKQNKYAWTVPFVLPAMFLAAGWMWKWWFT